MVAIENNKNVYIQNKMIIAYSSSTDFSEYTILATGLDTERKTKNAIAKLKKCGSLN
jgi:hypothetical protein